MFGKKASNNPGLSAIKDSNRVFVAGLVHQMLVIHPVCSLIIDILPRLPKGGSGLINFLVELPLVSVSMISCPCTPARPGTQYSPTVCWLEISFSTF